MPAYQGKARKQWFVERAHQTRFMMGLFLTVLVLVTISSSIVVLFFRNMITFLGQDSPAMWIPMILISSALLLIIELVLAVPVIYVLGVRQSHHIFGPMKRLQRTLEAIGNGDFSKRVTLRPRDDLQELAVSINTMAEHLERRSSPPAS